MNYCIFCMKEIEQGAAECPHCGKKQNAEIPAHHLLPGTILQNRFLIGAALGEGGFGITYIGCDLQLDLRVAIKEFYPNGYVNRSNTASPAVSIATAGERRDFFETGRERFLREARVLARFSSEEGIVTVRDYFQENNTAYIVMEYLDGQTLKDYLKDHGSLTPDQTLNLLRPVMLSLREVHKQGLIHRDIAPDNIMIVNGKVKLLDFGAARNMSSIANKSLSVVLKPGYAPEEQYRSKGNQGPWTDVYALAATMYKCITGEAPDDATQRLYTDELKTPSEHGVAIDPQFEAAIMKGLAVLQQDRYKSIDEFLNALDGKGEPAQNAGAAVVAPVPPRQVSKDPETGYYDEEPYKITTVIDTEKAAPETTGKSAKKPGKGLIIAIAAGAAVLLAGIILAVVLLGGKGKGDKGQTTVNNEEHTDGHNVEHTKEPVEEQPLVLSDDLYDSTFELDGVVYKLPMTFDKLTSSGWTITQSGYRDSTEIAGYDDETFTMGKNGSSVEVSVYNNTGNLRMIKDCIVYAVEGELYYGSNIKVSKGIDCNSSIAEIIAAFGTPAERSDYSDHSVLTYHKNNISGVQFCCYSAESGYKKYSSITVENVNIANETETVINTEKPDYLTKYIEPSTLGNDLMSGRIAVGGDIYQLPAPLSAFLNHGWKLRESGVVPAGGTKDISIERDGVWFYVYIMNLASYQTTAENCAVYKISIDSDRNVSAELPNGILLGSTTKAVVASKVNSDFYVYEGSYTCSYSYSDSNLDLRISVDNSTDKVSSITVSNKNWNY